MLAIDLLLYSLDLLLISFLLGLDETVSPVDASKAWGVWPVLLLSDLGKSQAVLQLLHQKC